MSRPATLIPWDTNGTNSTQPPSGHQTDGWSLGGTAVSAYDNYMKAAFCDWIEYLQKTAVLVELSHWNEVLDPSVPVFALDVQYTGTPLWIACDSNGDIHYSDDYGDSWTTVSSVHAESLYAICRSAYSGKWYTGGQRALGGTNPGLYYSSDGVSWSTALSLPASSYIRGICEMAAGNMCVVGRHAPSGTAPMIYTGALTSWTARTPGGSFGTYLYDVAYGASTVIAVGQTGQIQRSTDEGASWSVISPAGSYSGIFHGVAYDGTGTWVAVGESGEIQYSTDNGLTWTSTNPSGGYTGDFYAVKFGGGLFIAAGDTGELQVSEDGITWHRRLTGTTENFRGIGVNISTGHTMVGSFAGPTFSSLGNFR